MKKIALIAILGFGGFLAPVLYAQDEIAEFDVIDFKSYEYELQEFAEIEIVELPMAVQDAAAKDFENLRIYKAFIAKDNTYKIILKGKDNYTKVVFASANGEWIKPNDKS